MGLQDHQRQFRKTDTVENSHITSLIHSVYMAYTYNMSDHVWLIFVDSHSTIKSHTIGASYIPPHYISW